VEHCARCWRRCKEIPLGKREWVTFEYVLLGGVNDQPEHAREVLALLKGMKAKVNLIVWNPGPGIDTTSRAGGCCGVSEDADRWGDCRRISAGRAGGISMRHVGS
jgi:hypothetical protein